MIFINQRDLLDMLAQAYEEGWEGFKDLSESVAEEIMAAYLTERKEKEEQDSKKEYYIQTPTQASVVQQTFWDSVRDTEDDIVDAEIISISNDNNSGSYSVNLTGSGADSPTGTWTTNTTVWGTQ